MVLNAIRFLLRCLIANMATIVIFSKHSLKFIAVGAGGAGGAVAPPFGSKRRKSSKIRANGLFIWANNLDIGAHHCQNTVSVSVQTFFFFFFLESTSIWTEKPFKFQGRPFFFWRTSQFGQKKPSQF